MLVAVVHPDPDDSVVQGADGVTESPHLVYSGSTWPAGAHIAAHSLNPCVNSRIDDHYLTAHPRQLPGATRRAG
jgi:hypothetical protein